MLECLVRANHIRRYLQDPMYSKEFLKVKLTLMVIYYERKESERVSESFLYTLIYKQIQLQLIVQVGLLVTFNNMTPKS